MCIQYQDNSGRNYCWNPGTIPGRTSQDESLNEMLQELLKGICRGNPKIFLEKSLKSAQKDSLRGEFLVETLKDFEEIEREISEGIPK